MVLTLIEKEHLIDNVWAFRFKPAEPLTWVAGQYVGVELPHDNPDQKGTKRWFTNSAAPFEGIMQITTRVSDSTFKQTLAELEPGDELQMYEMPEGDFVWEETDLPKVFVAAGIGVTPFHSILKQRAHDGLPLDTTLIYGSRTPDVPFKDELAAWQSIDPKLKIHYVVGERLTVEKLKEIVPKLNQTFVYVSGPEPMVQAMCKELMAKGLSKAQLRRDEFPNYDHTNY